MFLSHLHKTLPITMAAVAMAGLACGPLAAQSTVTYTASGTFSTIIVSGADFFKLAGQAFSISIVASEAAVPVKTGAHWAEYNKLMLTGFVDSGLVPTPVSLASSNTAITLGLGNTNYDQFMLAFPFKIIGTKFTIKASMQAPKGTITTTAIGPFTAPVTLDSTNNTVTYEYSANGTPNSTTLTIASGTLTTTVSGQGPSQ